MSRILRCFTSLLALGAAASLFTSCATPPPTDDDFVDLFDGKSLKGWTLVGQKGDGYIVKDGMIVCTKGGGGNLLTEREYADFILRVDFRLEPGSNNGIGIRAPMTDKQIAYYGMELQVIDDTHEKYAKLKDWQFHGSVYGIVPAVRGALRPVGHWNTQEITCIGRQIKVVLNGQVIVDADLNSITDPEILEKHPGMLRDRGHIGFLGHNDYVEFRNIKIKELPVARIPNRVPQGFQALFNGHDLNGWQGLVETPPKRAVMTLDEWAEAQVLADEVMHQNWKIEDGALTYRGDGFDNLCTLRDYGNFELLVDWKIPENADSGVYLRGCPQVQIWDKPEGSGGLWNNKINSNKPLSRADYFVGEWNRFRILMLGERVTIYLNNELIVYDQKKREGITMENYWERDKPIYSRGPIELQAHKDLVQFRNVFIRELP